jgi:hypothetical protein
MKYPVITNKINFNHDIFTRLWYMFIGLKCAIPLRCMLALPSLLSDRCFVVLVAEPKPSSRSSDFFILN